MTHAKLFALGLTAALAACGSQSPAPVISGYTRMPWEPKLREIETSSAAQQAARATASAETLSTRVATPRMSEESFLASIEPAAGPATTPVMPVQRTQPEMGASQPQAVTHIVQKGETLYRIAHRNNLKVADLMNANNLISSSLHEGDILLVPTRTSTAVAPTPAVAAAPAQKTSQRYSLTRARFAKTQPTAAVQTAARQQITAPQAVLQVQEEKLASIQPAAGLKSASTQSAPVTYVTHHVASGETLYRIGKQYGASPLDLMSANNLDRPQDLKSGMMLRIPVSGTHTAATRQINSQLAQAKGMVWPARGKLLAKYGSQGNGVTHTGINILLPENTPIAAAETGTVIYADDGLKSYGNLVLLRHKDGLVTAYAHNNQLLVKKNQQVQKGEVIAYSGATGQVGSPQLHFEVRRNAQAINPLSILPK